MLKTIISLTLAILEKGVIIPILQTRRLKIKRLSYTVVGKRAEL